MFPLKKQVVYQPDTVRVEVKQKLKTKRKTLMKNRPFTGSLLLLFLVLQLPGCLKERPDENILPLLSSLQQNIVRTNARDASQPCQITLTWQNNPATSMTITWRTDISDENHTLRFTDRPDTDLHQWAIREAETSTFKETHAWLHTVELTNLQPGQTYYVIIDHPSSPEEFSFRTMPDENNRRELIFLAGADSRTMRDVKREMNALAAGFNPDFIIFDGDFISDPMSEQEWDDWFDDWHEQMITAGGRRIPIIPSIGNHEVLGGIHQPRENAPFYFHRFIVPEPRTRYALKLSPDLLLVTLDSDHILEITSQVDWLDETLTYHQNIKWKLVQYHVAAWPSARGFNDPIPVKIRTNWIPVLEKHGVNYVIEAHDHAFKKTVPIRDNRRDDENGIVYLGDGGWGAPLRDVKNPDDYWWLEEALKADNFWKFVLSANGKTLAVEPVFRN
jgi:acid phosphatase type 7